MKTHKKKYLKHFAQKHKIKRKEKLPKIKNKPDFQSGEVVRPTFVDVQQALTQVFSQTVQEEASQFPKYLHAQTLEKEKKKGRRDLRALKTFTIDGLDAKDLDDALSIEKTKDGFTLWVHIADVSHYVTENSAIDCEAVERTTSTYLPQGVIPMLPQALSNGLCSLHPANNRLALTVQLALNDEGKVYEGDIYESIIRSDLRMDYTTVYQILEKQKKCPLAYKPFLQELEWLKQLTFLRKERGDERGVFHFTSKELKMRLDEHQVPIEVYPYETTYAQDMIEEAMILANTFVSERFSRLGAPFLYRVHETPTLEKCLDFVKVAHRLGLNISFENPKHQKHWSALSKRFQEDFAATQETRYQVLNLLLLRAMAKARYSSTALGHYGLALKYYSHFTSPIRRYPDLFIHRVIKYYLHHKRFQTHWFEQAEHLAEQCSAGEKRAVSLERLATEIKCAEYMKQHLGFCFQAQVVGFIPAGCFLELENGIEGFLPFSEFPTYMVYDEKALEARSRKGEWVLTLGQVLEVQVVRVDESKAHIDFALTPQFFQNFKADKKIKRRKRR